MGCSQVSGRDRQNASELHVERKMHNSAAIRWTESEAQMWSKIWETLVKIEAWMACQDLQ